MLVHLYICLFLCMWVCVCHMHASARRDHKRKFIWIASGVPYWPSLGCIGPGWASSWPWPAFPVTTLLLASAHFVFIILTKSRFWTCRCFPWPITPAWLSLATVDWRLIWPAPHSCYWLRVKQSCICISRKSLSGTCPASLFRRSHHTTFTGLAWLTFHSDSFHPLSKSAVVRTKVMTMEIMKATVYCVLMCAAVQSMQDLIFNTATWTAIVTFSLRQEVWGLLHVHRTGQW